MNYATTTQEPEVEVEAIDEETTTLPEGQPFEAIVRRLQAEQSNRLDLIVNTARNARILPTDDGVRLQVNADEIDVHGVFDITPHAHNQIATHAGVPREYYQRMLAEDRDLLKLNIERWWEREPALRMARMLTPKGDAIGLLGNPRCRAWMGNGYRVVDNFDFSVAALDAATEYGPEIMRSHVDDNRLYLKLLVPGTVELPVAMRRGGAGLHAYHLRFGVILSNSEVGAGAISVRYFMSQWECTNDTVFTKWGSGDEAGFRAIHAGSRKTEGILSPATLQKEAEVVLDKVRDVTRYALNPARQGEIIDRLAQTTTVTVDTPARVAVANLVSASGMTQTEAHAVLERYLRGNDDTQWGLAAAVTNAAHSTPKSYHKRVELEAFGGKLLEMEAQKFASLVGKPLTEKQLAKTFGEN